MTPHDQYQHATWRKSSYSQGATQCVEAADVGGMTAIRDSKDPAGPVLLLASTQMRALVCAIRTGQLGI
jgi:Domain of unknown function (DUF397)